MGKLSKRYFNLNKLPENAIMIGGFHTLQKIRNILKLFESTKNLKYPATQAHLVRYKRKVAVILFNIWGAARSLSMLRILKDGGCKRIFLLGWAGTKQNIPIGTFIIPKKVRCFDGITHLANPKVKYASPDNKLFKELIDCFNKNKVKYVSGVTLTEPTIWHRIPYIDKESKKYLAIDMELAPLLYFSKISRIKSMGIIIIIDNPKFPLSRFRIKRYDKLKEGVKLIRNMLRS